MKKERWNCTTITVRFCQLAIAACLIAMAVILGGCGFTKNLEAAKQEAAADGEVESGEVLLLFTAADLRFALADAKSHNDTIAAQCWEKLLDTVAKIQEGGTVGQAAPGAFSAFQKKRNIQRFGQSQERQEITIACAPLVSDERRTILRIAGLVGLKVLSGGL